MQVIVSRYMIRIPFGPNTWGNLLELVYKKQRLHVVQKLFKCSICRKLTLQSCNKYRRNWLVLESTSYLLLKGLFSLSNFYLLHRLSQYHCGLVLPTISTIQSQDHNTTKNLYRIIIRPPRLAIASHCSRYITTKLVITSTHITPQFNRISIRTHDMSPAPQTLPTHIFIPCIGYLHHPFRNTMVAINIPTTCSIRIIDGKRWGL